MLYLVKVRFVNNDGRLSSKTYEYKTRISMPNGVYFRYFNIETSDGNNYRNSNVVIINYYSIAALKFYGSPAKEIVKFTAAGTLISEKHLQEIGRKNTITLIEPCDSKFTFSDSSASSNCVSNLNQSSMDKWIEEAEWTISGTPKSGWVELSKASTNNLNKTEEKENKSMSENIIRKFKFGLVHKSAVKMSPFGIAFKNNEDGWVTINDEGVMTSVEGMVFDMPLIYMMPVAVKDVQIGDYIDHNGDWVKVMDENERGNFVCLHPWRGEEVNVIPAKSPFGFDFVTKLVCFGEDMFTGKDASAQSPFGSMLPFMLMANGDMNDNSMLPLMLMMQNDGGALDMSNPFMLMALMGDKNGSKNDLMLPLMYSMMAKKEHKCDGHCKNCGD